MYCSLCKKKLPRKGFVHYHYHNGKKWSTLPVHKHCQDQHLMTQKILKAAGHKVPEEPTLTGLWNPARVSISPFEFEKQMTTFKDEYQGPFHIKRNGNFMKCFAGLMQQSCDKQIEDVLKGEFDGTSIPQTCSNQQQNRI